MTIRDHVSSIQQKPEHVRRRIAVVTSGSVTGLIALAWVVTLAANGSFSLAPSSKPNTDTVALTTESSKSLPQLLGAVGATLTGTATETPALTVVETKTTSTLDRPQQSPSATVIPF